ncbi:hypothetical protein CHARACLAT_019009 [Characodon lateralis]|uniref:XK-related protein n=1 Tax=Characodon lateralis TaxID=208331 RepID=A0ABU7CPL0_9TELE|nr:hypothetical protein [Characodon lateralis]
MHVFEYSTWDCFFTSAGLPLFLLDIVLDVLAAVNFYQEEAYLCLAVLLVLLIGSSVLTQLYSWFWYSYDEFDTSTKVEGFLKPSLAILHMFQLGIYVRHAAVLETSFNSRCSDASDPGDLAVYLNHDLSLLRIMETFSESAPQIILMLTVILQEGKLDPVTVLKTVASLSAVAFCVTTYHRCLRSFLPEKEKQPIVSSIIFFFWNLLLLSSRVVALALFASVEPCFIFTHFFCSWLLLFFFAWRSKTTFMDSAGGEWLYRATVGLIWYFNWFNMVDGKTRKRTIVYHTYILVDISVLCGVWYWKMSSDFPHIEMPCLQAAIVGGAVVSVYMVGLVCKIIYYRFFHPKLYKEELIGDTMNEQQRDEVDSGLRGAVAFRGMNRMPSEPGPRAHCNKRMKKLAENFYSKSADGAEA